MKELKQHILEKLKVSKNNIYAITLEDIIFLIEIKTKIRL